MQKKKERKNLLNVSKTVFLNFHETDTHHLKMFIFICGIINSLHLKQMHNCNIWREGCRYCQGSRRYKLWWLPWMQWKGNWYRHSLVLSPCFPDDGEVILKFGPLVAVSPLVGMVLQGHSTVSRVDFRIWSRRWKAEESIGVFQRFWPWNVKEPLS